MNWTLGQPAYPRFLMLDATDGTTPLDSLAWSDLDCRYASYAATSFAIKALSGPAVQNLGLGFYRIYFSAAEINATGLWTFYLSALGAIPSWREDTVVEAASAWEGNLVTIWTMVSGIGIPDCHVQIRNSAGTTVLAQGLTDVAGSYTAILVAGTYKVYCWKPGYTFASFPATIVVTASASFIVTGTVFSPDNPGGPDVTTINGWLLDSTGAARVGVAVSFTPILDDEVNVSEKETLRPLASTSTSKLIARIPIVATTDAAGAFSVSLTPNSDITPAGSRYRVTFSDTVADVALIAVPATGPVNIEDLLPTT